MLELSLRYLYEAAQAGSMRAASEKIGVAVSSISRQIAQLEQNIGMPLLEKNRRTARLTEAGELVCNYHRQSMIDLGVLREQIRDLRGVKSGSVHISVGEGFLSTLFIDMMTDFRRDNPGIEISVTVEPTTEAVRRVLDDEVHVGLVFQAPAEPRIRVRAVFPQPLQAVCHPKHPLAMQPFCTLADLGKHALALPPANTRIRALLADAERKHGAWLSADLVSNSISALRELARAGAFVAVLPRTSVIGDVQTGALAALPIAETELDITEMAIITRLGRQLGKAPSRLLMLIEAKLRSAIQ